MHFSPMDFCSKEIIFVQTANNSSIIIVFAFDKTKQIQIKTLFADFPHILNFYYVIKSLKMYSFPSLFEDVTLKKLIMFHKSMNNSKCGQFLHWI
jgi:hypothetical protein